MTAFAVLDYTVYTANLSSPTYQTSGPDFQPYYSAKAAYGSLLSPPVTDPAAELTPAFWHNVTALFESDDSVFQTYIDRKQRGYDYESCNGTCKTTEICGLRSSQSQYACVGSNPVLQAPSAKRRDVEVKAQARHQHDHDCSGSVFKDVFRKLAGKGEKAFVRRSVDRRG